MMLSAARIQVICIGASTGGPAALSELFSHLKGWHSAVPIFVVVHLPEVFGRELSQKLAAESGLDVRMAEDGEIAQPGIIYLAPGGKHLEIRPGGRMALTLDPPVHFCRPSVDVTLNSLVQRHRAGVMAIILTGMGQDGSDGARAVAQAGGMVLVQHRDSCVVWGMPKAVVESGIKVREESLHMLANAMRQHASAKGSVQP